MKFALSVVVAFLTLTAPASADLVGHFDRSAGGWQIGGPRSVVYRAGGGNPGGHLEFAADGKGGQQFISPFRWGGDQRGALGRNVRFDLRVPTADYSGAEEPLRLLGGGPSVSGNIPDDLIWSQNFDPSPSWQHFDVPLAPGPGWTRLHDGQPATAADFERVLGNLGALGVGAVFARGSGSTVSLDNVVFEGATERPALDTDLRARFGIYKPVQTATKGRAYVLAENRGSAGATDVVVTVRLPRGARHIRAPRRCKRAGSRTLICKAGYLGARAGEFGFEVRWKPGRRTGTQRIRATVKHAAADPNPANNTATYTFRRSGRG